MDQKKAAQLPPLSKTLITPDTTNPASTILELDELWSFVAKKTNQAWIWIALCRQTRQVVACGRPFHRPTVLEVKQINMMNNSEHKSRIGIIGVPTNSSGTVDGAALAPLVQRQVGLLKALQQYCEKERTCNYGD
jgi:hypothetical protein